MSDFELLKYANENSAHESGHMVFLFKEGKRVELNFLPHEIAADGNKGVFEANIGVELDENDCVALAAGMAGELIRLGGYDPQRVMHDRQRVQLLVGRALEDFAAKAQEVIEQNLRFFSLLNVEIRNRIYAQLLQLEVVDWDKLPKKIRSSRRLKSRNSISVLSPKNQPLDKCI
jgi:hypothetical protein